MLKAYLSAQYYQISIGEGGGGGGVVTLSVASDHLEQMEWGYWYKHLKNGAISCQ